MSHPNFTPGDFVLPAEWEPQSGIQLTWPHADTDWKPYLDDITATFIEMTRTIARYEPVLIVTPQPDIVAETLRCHIDEAALRNVSFHAMETNDTWARDHGAITLTAWKTMDGEAPAHRLLDFKFNGWGEKFAWEKDNLITRRLQAQGAFTGIVEDHDDLVLEGGSIESDGRGTVFTTSQCLLAPNRNQPLSQTEIEEQLRRRLHAERIVWLDHGNLIGDDTDGHIDTIVRLAPDDTLLYIGSDDMNDEQFEDFNALEQQLKQLKTADGRPYRLLRLPMPTAIYDDGERLPATYANFVIMNGAVMVPTYDQPEKDQEALRTIGLAFPGRDIIGVDSRTVIRQHGSLHCLTMQFPEGALAL